MPFGTPFKVKFCFIFSCTELLVWLMVLLITRLQFAMFDAKSVTLYSKRTLPSGSWILFGGFNKVIVGAITSVPITKVLFSDMPLNLSSEISTQPMLHIIVTLLKLLIAKLLVMSLVTLYFVKFKVP